MRADHRAQTITVRYVPARVGEAELAVRLARLGYEPVAVGR